MNFFNAIAAVIAIAGVLPAHAKHVTGCQDIGCYSILLGKNYDAVAWQLSNGKTFSGNITCRPGNYILHDGWVGTLHDEGVRVLVEVHCDNRSRLFQAQTQ